MNLVLADLPGAALEGARDLVSRTDGAAGVLATPTDVSNLTSVTQLKDIAFQRFGNVSVLMNNAGVGRGGGAFAEATAWRRVIETNLWGVIHGVSAFAQAMVDQRIPALIINTGFKQGITTPPGDTAYNVSKAGVKVVTEGLQHELRNLPNCLVSAHLLIPGFTFTGMTDRADKPAGAWTADQVVDELIKGVNENRFYIICPDNDVTSVIDNKRMRWAADDAIKNRPPLSRWHADYLAKFAAFMTLDD